MSNKHLVAGPFIGEFGWELFCWQGYLRRIAQHYSKVPVVFCRTGHEFLYEDFADVQFFNPVKEETDMWKNSAVVECRNNFRGIRDYFNIDDTCDYISFDSFKSRWWDTECYADSQDLIKFTGKPMQQGYDILLIIRDTEKCNTGFRNWPLNDANAFACDMQELGYTIACVGKKQSASTLSGVDDLRDIPLYELAGIMSNSKVLVGPQCGVTHFATLCGLPQVAWQTKKEHAMRMISSSKWNPFAVKTKTICSPCDNFWTKRKMWLPSEATIIYNTNEILNGKGGSID